VQGRNEPQTPIFQSIDKLGTGIGTRIATARPESLEIINPLPGAQPSQNPPCEELEKRSAHDKTTGKPGSCGLVGKESPRRRPWIWTFADTHRFLARGKRTVLNRSTDPSGCLTGTGKQDQYGTHTPKCFLLEPPSNSCDSLSEASRSPSIADTHLPQHRQARYRNLNADSDCKAGELGNNQPTAGSPAFAEPRLRITRKRVRSG